MYFTSSISVRINVNMHSYLDNPACSIFAHRGGSIESYENTIESFNYAVDLGCEYIETDVQLSSDGVPYIFHDEDLKRLTGSNRPFHSHLSSEINDIKLFDQFKIPTLEETLITFLTSKKMILKYYDELMMMGTIRHHPMEKKLHEIYEAEICLSPVPSLAMHATNINSSYGIPPLFDWKKVWDENEI